MKQLSPAFRMIGLRDILKSPDVAMVGAFVLFILAMGLTPILESILFGSHSSAFLLIAVVLSLVVSLIVVLRAVRKYGNRLASLIKVPDGQLLFACRLSDQGSGCETVLCNQSLRDPSDTWWNSVVPVAFVAVNPSKWEAIQLVCLDEESNTRYFCRVLVNIELLPDITADRVEAWIRVTAPRLEDDFDRAFSRALSRLGINRSEILPLNSHYQALTETLLELVDEAKLRSRGIALTIRVVQLDRSKNDLSTIVCSRKGH